MYKGDNTESFARRSRMSKFPVVHMLPFAATFQCVIASPPAKKKVKWRDRRLVGLCSHQTEIIQFRSDRIEQPIPLQTADIYMLPYARNPI